MAIRLYYLLFLVIFYGCQSQPHDAPSDPPNIILFLVDDLGWQDLAVPFWDRATPKNQIYRTPNLQRLAAQGMKFSQAYATAVCSPTRVSLMTGMNAARHRVTNWTLHANKMQPMESEHPDLRFPLWNVNGISSDPLEQAVHATTLPMILKNNGYHTIHVGKAHLGAIGTPGENPLNLGFMTNIAGHAAGAPKSYYGLENFGNTTEFAQSPWPVPGLEHYHGKDIFLTEALTNEALKTLDSISQPFFLYMSYYAVHTPIMANNEFLDHYLMQGMDSIEASYASMIESMDKSVGRVLDYLENKGLTETTIVLFMSDNGGLSAVARGGEVHTHNLPLSSGKGSIHEGGIREPMIVKWPQVTPPGSVNDNYLIIEDFFPTILDMAGVRDYTTVQAVDGRSFTPLLKTARSSQSRPLYWHYPNEWGPSGPGIGAFSAVRYGPWKLIYYHLDQSFELFNIVADIGESNNLIDIESDKALELTQKLTDYLKSVSAQMPQYRTTGEQVPWPLEAFRRRYSALN